MKDDVISRQAAIDCCRNEWKEEVAERIEALPSAQLQDIARDIATIIENEKDMRVVLNQQRWIPVSEDTPKKRDWYLGIFKEPDTGWINPLPFICDYVGRETKATTKEGWILRGYTEREEHIDYYFNLECVAWMSLPEPYKGEQNDHQDRNNR